MPRLITRLSIRSVLLAGLALLACCAPAQAAFPGRTGRSRCPQRPTIYTMNPDGTGQTNITNNPQRRNKFASLVTGRQQDRVRQHPKRQPRTSTR